MANPRKAARPGKPTRPGPQWVYTLTKNEINPKFLKEARLVTVGWGSKKEAGLLSRKLKKPVYLFQTDTTPARYNFYADTLRVKTSR